MLSYQSPMPAAAGTPRYENESWSLEVFGCGWCHPSPLDSRFRENDEAGAGGIQAYLRPRNTIIVPMNCITDSPTYRSWWRKRAGTASGSPIHSV